MRQWISVLALTGLALGGCAGAPQTTARPATAPSGLSTCPLATLPREASDTVRDIHAGGPFPFPRNDGVVFGNRERHLPEHRRNYYREYTVVTPGSRTRATRRIITGGSPPTDPPEYFYTADHYDSFCAIADAGRPR